uniref:Vacuolar protein sorting-associated protein 51 homolog n=1 Tax=Kalanchoe fedtschenkoi TaxID=63787 RepID=A0A7N0VG53_KALFE
MTVDDVPMDDKAKRMRDLLSSFYAPDPANASSSSFNKNAAATLDAINTPSFDPDQYMNLLVQKSSLEGLLQRHVEMAAEIKNLDTDLQMLVYENYNKFISATDTIKRMKNNIVGMEANMEQLLEKIMSVQSRSDGVNTSLFEKREHIEKLHRTRNLLRKVQFIYDLPTRLGKCIKSGAYADAVRYYTGAMPIFKVYGDSSFQDCKKASEEAVAIIMKNLQDKLFSDSESIQARAEAVMLLKQLNFPVDALRSKLLEKLEQFLVDLQVDYGTAQTSFEESDKHSTFESKHITSSHEASICEFAEAVRAYRAMFPDSETQLIKLGENLVNKHFEMLRQQIKLRIDSSELVRVLGIIWTDVNLMDEVLPEAGLMNFSFEAAQDTIREYVRSKFSYLQMDMSEALLQVQSKKNEGEVEGYPLQFTLDASKNLVIQGSLGLLAGFRQILEENLVLLVKLRDLIIDWAQDGFQEFFRNLNDHFIQLADRNTPDQGLAEGMQGEKVHASLVLVLALLSVYIEQSAIPRIAEEITASFDSGGVRGYAHGPIFAPGEICKKFQTTGEKLLHHYINMRTQRLSALLRKRFSTPNWVKHKEPREVHMFVDLLLQELEAIGAEARQILPQGHLRKHRRADSNGSTTSSRSNPLRDDRLSRSNTQRARSQLLESHLAKLFKQKMEIFTKVEFTQESVMTTIVKLCLKSLQEYVRLQTFNRSGFQQIQLDIQFLRNALKESVEDEAAMDFLLDEVIVAASERCLDPIPLEPPILDRLIQAKLDKDKQQNPAS